MLSFISSFALDSILNTLIGFFSLIQFFLGKFLATMAQWLGYFLKFQGNYFENIAIVQESWKIFRDFSNMFFILILIIMAFATILDLQNYNWKGLMAKFIIAALLINFSMAIGGFLIKISTTLSNVAINQFTNITDNLAAGFGINKFITAAPTAGTSSDLSANLALSAYLSTTGNIILTVIILCAFISALAFSIARVPVLWALLIVSPVAWISYILPQTRKIWDMWWNWFLCWTFFMPAYLFSLVIGIGILNNRPDIAAANTATSFFGFGVQEIFFYVLTVTIMFGSLAFGMKMACAAGTGAVATFGAISGRVNKFAKENTYYNSLKKGLLGKAAEIQDTGFKSKLGGALYGGERAERLREAKVAEIFGQKGALSEQEAGEVKKSYDRWKSQNLGKDELNALNTQAAAGKFNKFELLALRQLRAENGWVATGANGVAEIESTLRQAGENSKFAQNYIDALKKNGFAEALGSIGEAENLARNTSILSLKKAVLETMAKNNQIISEDLIKKTLQVFVNESQSAKDAIEKELQKNIKNFAETRSKKDREKYLLDSSKDGEIRRLLAQQMAEDGEITTYQKYKTAAELFGGENETKSREMLGKIAKDKPLAHADYLFRNELRGTDPSTEPADYDPLNDSSITPTEKTRRQEAFKKKVVEKLVKMSSKAITESDLDILKRPETKAALWDYIEKEEKAERTKKGKGGKQKPGKGKRFIQRLQKAFQDNPDPEKEKILDRMMESLEANYPAI